MPEPTKLPLSIHFRRGPGGNAFRLSLVTLLLVSGASTSAKGQEPPTRVSKEIDRLMTALDTRGQFNGSILVSSDGSVIYRHSFGYADLAGKRRLTPETPSCIGSVTKPFTALAIMMLADEGKLSFDDPVSKFVQPFASSPTSRAITLRHLLNHTSGIPDFTDLGIDDNRLTKADFVLQLLTKHSLFARAGDRYSYSNPGYFLLQFVIEKVSGKSYSAYLEQKVFSPLQMRHTYVFDGLSRDVSSAATGVDQFGHQQDAGPSPFPASGGIYSTVDDLSKFDRALASGQLVRPATLEQAYKPAKIATGESAYGFGWNLGDEGGEKYTWHTGSAGGFRAFIERRPDRRLTVIMLTNRGNSKRSDINKAILAITSGQPYELPKISITEKLYPIIMKSGVQAALYFAHRALAKSKADYDFSERDLNSLGYQLLYTEKRPTDSIAIFKLTTTVYPNSSNAFDSLGEAHLHNGGLKQAILCYEKAVKLDPTNIHAVTALKELKLKSKA